MHLASFEVSYLGVNSIDSYFWSFKMNMFLGLDQDFFKNIIVEAIEVAQEEARIEEELTVIRDHP